MERIQKVPPLTIRYKRVISRWVKKNSVGQQSSISPPKWSKIEVFGVLTKIQIH